MPDSRQADRLHVFLCYASEDKAQVVQLYKRLSSDGLAPWLDSENILPGQNWDLEIRKAVGLSQVVLVCLSARSLSKEGYVNREIRHALDLADEKPEGSIFLIPARLEDCPVPDRLKQWQWVDLFQPDGYTRLLRALNLRAAQVNRKIVDPPAQGLKPIAIRSEESPSENPVGLVRSHPSFWEKNFKFVALLVAIFVVLGGWAGLQNAGWFSAPSALMVTFDGSADVLVGKRTDSANTPDNNENKGSCSNEVGRHDSYCVSRTSLQLTTKPPRFFKNVKTKCEGGGCPYGSDPPPFSLSADGLEATAFFDNWGSAVRVLLYADEYERVTSADCGSSTIRPIRIGESLPVTVPSRCVPIAQVQWRHSAGGPPEGSFLFGQGASPGGEVVQVGEREDLGSSVRISYMLVR